MQSQDVKTIVKCCLFFFICKKKIPCLWASALSFASMLLSGVEIYLYFYLKGHCKWVEASTAGRSEVRRRWRPRHHTLAPRRFIHQQSPSPPSFHRRLCYWDVGGWRGAVIGALIQQQLLFFSPFENVLCSFFLLLFFFCFFLKENRTARHFHQPVTSSSDHSVAGGDRWRKHSKHAIKCWLF